MKGTLKKLKSELNSDSGKVHYWLPLGEQFLDLEPYLEKPLQLKHTGNIYCIDTGKKVKQSYGQGYSWEAYVTLPECDQCIFQPELCHYAKGTCRDPKWGEEHCFKPHVIYLSLTSNLKVGITRLKQVPTRWVDQGAVQAIKICEVKDRLSSGMIEIEIAKKIGDKTNWRNMLKNQYPQEDLLKRKNELWEKYADLFKKYDASRSDDNIVSVDYPVVQYPEKVSSLSFDKTKTVGGTLMGIKGQYLIFDTGVINIRKFQGYEVEVEG